jgi:hypothetical protein
VNPSRSGHCSRAHCVELLRGGRKRAMEVTRSSLNLTVLVGDAGASSGAVDIVCWGFNDD